MLQQAFKEDCLLKRTAIVIKSLKVVVKVTQKSRLYLIIGYKDMSIYIDISLVYIVSTVIFDWLDVVHYEFLATG